MTRSEEVAKEYLKAYLDKGQEFNQAKENAIIALVATNAFIDDKEDKFDLIGAAYYLKSLTYWKP